MNRLTRHLWLLVPAALCTVTNLLGEVWISEIRTNQPGPDTDEYFELYSSDNNVDLNRLTYLVIGDGTAGSGVIESVVELRDQSLNLNTPFFVVSESSFSLTERRADMIAHLNFENDDNVTHLLVRDFTGKLGEDLDANDDGALDHFPWNTVIDGISLRAKIRDGDQIYAPSLGLESIGPDQGHAPTHVYRENNSNRFNIGAFPLGQQDTPGAPNATHHQDILIDKTISEIQGTNSISSYVGSTVRTRGIIVGDFQGEDELRGFFLQDPIGDMNPKTSDGIFVFDPTGPDLSIGDHIQVTGQVIEHHGLTELNRVSHITKQGTGTILPTQVTLPGIKNGDLERYEGMLIHVTTPMTISQNYFLQRYGQLTLSSPDDSGLAGRLFQPTQLFPPGANARKLADENQRRLLILDDGQDSNPLGDYPNPIPYLKNIAGKNIRSGDQVDRLIGVLDYGRINSNQSDPARDYRLHPTLAPIFTSKNPRPTGFPPRNGNLTVASFNVLNYFLTLNRRGARTHTELVRQQGKLLAAMNSIDADILGLIEVENDDGASVQDLVNELNRSSGTNRYRAIRSGKIGQDAIKTAFIYKQDIVTPLGGPQVLDDSIDPRVLSNRNRPALAQTFRRRTSNDALTIVVNHFKSRGSPCNDIGDPNRSDGQGNCNGTRTSMARALVDWLTSDPNSSFDEDVLIIGDLNAYAKEDPIRTIEEKGFVNLIELFHQGKAYTYTFDGQAGYLDHALASESLSQKARSIEAWHINADESTAWDYHNAPNSLTLSQPDEFRSSDHDPIIIGLQMGVDAPRGENPSREISSIQHEGTHLRLRFTGSPDQSYQVEFTNTLASPRWQSIGTVRADSQGRITFQDRRPMRKSGFFRIHPNLFSE